LGSIRFRMAGHPRVRGEHTTCVDTISTSAGSSPRARGTRAVGGHDSTRLRVIPACAGNTFGGDVEAAGLPGHPRVRGEHVLTVPSLGTVNGSSPRARGTPEHLGEVVRVQRVIPACAGNTPARVSRWRGFSGHPRVRGEHFERIRHRPGGYGSSPRARGTRAGEVNQGLRCRVIPACAGNTSHLEPKSRGSTGSSPRARGTHGWHEGRVRQFRVIPACAGNTQLAHCFVDFHAGHPRVRGEHSELSQINSRGDGSSPRARGTRRRQATRRAVNPGHPRVRGEHATC